MLKKYILTFDWWEAVLEIKDDEKTLGHMKDQLLFFTGGQDLIDDEDGDVTVAYLKQTTPSLIKESMQWNKSGIITQIADSMYEGFLPIDGSFGVTLISVDNWEFAENEIMIKNVSQAKQNS